MCGSRTLLQIKTEKFRTVLCIEQKKSYLCDFARVVPLSVRVGALVYVKIHIFNYQ